MVASKRQVAEYLHERVRRAASETLIAFADYCFQGSEYVIGWHNQLIAHELDTWLNSKTVHNLILMVPPRHGKSELVSRLLPAYIFGKWPDKSIIAVSYSVYLMTAMSKDSQRIMTSQEYSQVFPETKLAGSSGQKIIKGVSVTQTAAEFEIVGFRGKYMAAGVGTGITGHGIDVGIIDDPFKDRAEAESEVIRKKVWDWYTSTFRARLEKGAKQVLLMTRWHEDDLAGRLIRRMEDVPGVDQWKIVSLPALFEKNDYNHPLDKRSEGEALWPYKYDRKNLLNTKATVGSYDFNSLYQQNPSPPEGAIAKRQWFKIIDLPQIPIFWVRFWDIAVSSDVKADYTTGVQMGVDARGNFYIRDVIRGQWIWPDAKKVIINTALSQQKVPVGLESVGTQKGLVDDIVADYRLLNVNIAGYNVEGNKLSRALVWFARLEAGLIYLIKGDWNQDYIDEVVKFRGIPGDVDDQVDGTSGAYRMLLECHFPYYEEIGQYD